MLASRSDRGSPHACLTAFGTRAGDGRRFDVCSGTSGAVRRFRRHRHLAATSRGRMPLGCAPHGALNPSLSDPQQNVLHMAYPIFTCQWRSNISIVIPFYLAA